MSKNVQFTGNCAPQFIHEKLNNSSQLDTCKELLHDMMTSPFSACPPEQLYNSSLLSFWTCPEANLKKKKKKKRGGVTNFER